MKRNNNKNFDEYQKSVLETDFPLICIAGPGSGKTTVMIEKILNTATLDNIDKLLILTFTNNAANEIKKRLNQKFGIEKNYQYIGTFHSVFYKLLIENKNYLYKYNNFNINKMEILTPEDDYKLFELTFENTPTLFQKPENITKKEYETSITDKIGLKIKDIYYILNNITKTNTNNSLEDIYKEFEEQYTNKLKKFSISINFNQLENYIDNLKYIIMIYNQRKINWGLLNFNDILFYFNVLLNNYEKLRKKIQNKFDYIFIDEMQDTNKIQIQIVEKIFNNNFFMIGDPYQSIYKFLGADINNFIKYIKNSNKKVNVKQLVYNYRSKENIVELINKFTNYFKDKTNILENNYKSFNQKKGKIKKIPFDFMNKNLLSILKEELNNNNNSFNNIAILSRNNFELIEIEFLLNNNNIPYKKISGKNLYEILEIKYINDIIKFWIDKSPLSFLNLISTLEGIGAKSLEKIIAIHYKLINILDFSNLKTLKKFEKEINNIKISKKAVDNLLNFISYFYNEFSFENLKLITKENKFIEKRLKNSKSLEKEMEKKLLIENYFNLLKPYTTSKTKIKKFITETLLQSEKFSNNNSNNGIILSTIHSSKGLEWDSVFIINIDGENLPYKSKNKNPENLEEEKRLLYVGISRAKNNLFLFSKKDLYYLIKNLSE